MIVCVLFFPFLFRFVEQECKTKKHTQKFHKTRNIHSDITIMWLISSMQLYTHVPDSGNLRHYRQKSILNMLVFENFCNLFSAHKIPFCFDAWINYYLYLYSKITKQRKFKRNIRQASKMSETENNLLIRLFLKQTHTYTRVAWTLTRLQ